MKLSISLSLLVSQCCIAIAAGTGASATATAEGEPAKAKASELHAQLRQLQPQSCAGGSSSLTGSGRVRLVSLGASPEFSAHVCFDETTGVAVGEFLISTLEDAHATYHVHCAARDETTGGIFLGTELDTWVQPKGDAEKVEVVVEDAASPDDDATATTGRKLAKKSGKSGKNTRSPKAPKSPKSSKATCGCDLCASQDNVGGTVPLCEGDAGYPGTRPCCDCVTRRLEEETGNAVRTAEGNARKNREAGGDAAPQGTLAFLYFGGSTNGGDDGAIPEFGLRLFADFDHSCATFREQMKDFGMEEDIAPFESGSFSIHNV